MTHAKLVSRRALARLLLGSLGVAWGGMLLGRAAKAAELLAPEDPQAKALRYTEDASRVPEAQGNRCASCALYQGPNGSPQGPCQLFAGKDVKASGWCTSWAPQM